MAHALLPQGLTADHLRFKLYSIQQELLRTKEELEYLPQDAVNTLQYFQQQQEILNAVHSKCEAALSEAGSPWAGEYLRGRLHILACWQAHVGRLYKTAWTAFSEAGWVAAPMT